MNPVSSSGDEAWELFSSGLEGVDEDDRPRASAALRREYESLGNDILDQMLPAMAEIRDNPSKANTFAQIIGKKSKFFKDNKSRLSNYTSIKLCKEIHEMYEELCGIYESTQKDVEALDMQYKSYLDSQPMQDPSSSEPSEFLALLRMIHQQPAGHIAMAANNAETFAKLLRKYENVREKRKKVSGRGSAALQDRAMKFAESQAHILPVKFKVNPMPTFPGPRPQVNYHGMVDNDNTKVTVITRTNNHNRIVGRMVQKTGILTQIQWRSATSFRGAGEDSVPLEWYTQTIMGNAESARFALDTLGECKFAEPARSYIFYMPYTPHGTLETTIASHLGPSNIPEQFLWLVMQALAETVMVMKQGGVTDATNGWQEIVHMDMKPANIFLDVPEQSHFPLFPRPRVADYGVSFFTSADDESNPTVWTDSGTPGYMPPEQCPFVEESTQEPIDDFKILSPCNVWGIGAIMYAMIMQEHPLQPKYRDEVTNDHELELKGEKVNWCSQELCQKVNECLKHDPWERPKIDDLLAWVNQHIQEDEYLRKADTGDQDPNDTLQLFWKPDDQYRIGMAVR